MRERPARSRAVSVYVIVVLAFAAFLVWHRFRPGEKLAATPAPEAATQVESAPAQSSSENIQPAAATAEELSALVPLPLGPALAGSENNSWLKDKAYLAVPRGTQ